MRTYLADFDRDAQMHDLLCIISFHNLLSDWSNRNSNTIVGTVQSVTQCQLENFSTRDFDCTYLQLVTFLLGTTGYSLAVKHENFLRIT